MPDPSQVGGTTKSSHEDHGDPRAETQGRWDKTRKVRLCSSLRLRASARVDLVASRWSRFVRNEAKGR